MVLDLCMSSDGGLHLSKVLSENFEWHLKYKVNMNGNTTHDILLCSTTQNLEKWKKQSYSSCTLHIIWPWFVCFLHVVWPWFTFVQSFKRKTSMVFDLKSWHVYLGTASQNDGRIDRVNKLWTPFSNWGYSDTIRFPCSYLIHM